MSTNAINLSSQIQNGEKTDFFTILPQELLTNADRTSQSFSHPTAMGMLLVIVLANEAGTASIAPVLKFTDPAGNAHVLWTGSALTANGTYTYLIFPGGSSNAGTTTVVDLPLPREWTLVLDYTGTAANDKIDTLVYGAYI